jgi:PLP dependent protein
LRNLFQNLAKFKEELKSVCQNCGRNISEISLVAVTKNHSAEEVNELIKSGVTQIGENRLQEALEKFPDLNECEKHFVGHIQSNKAKEVAQNFDVIQSVSSLKVAQILNDSATTAGSGVSPDHLNRIFLQANLAGEEQKSGFLARDLAGAIKAIHELPQLEIQGLMVMGVLGDAEKTRAVFAQAKKLNDKLGFKSLSMGMSGDWQIAVEEGATHLRVGSLLFK